MKTDPLDDATLISKRRPRLTGRGSGKEAWVEWADFLQGAAQYWRDISKEQSAAIKDLEAEIALLRQQVAERKPKGGRPRTPDETVNRIEAELGRGTSPRHVARMFGVAHVTVYRIKARMAAREAAA